MNILYLAHRIPYPPNKGDKLRAFRQIEFLSRRHRIWCACFIDDPRDVRHIRGLTSYCADLAVIELKPFCAYIRGLWSLARGRTVTEGFYASREMTAALDRWQTAIAFDAVIAFSSSIAQYALHVPAPRRVLDLCDLDSLKWADYAEHNDLKPRRTRIDRALAKLYRKEGARLSAAELRWIDGFDATLLATASEAAPLRPLVSPRKIHVVGNGVVVPEPQENLELSQQSTINNRQSTIRPVVGFIGVMDYLPNIDAVTWFAFQCWPAIRSRFPEAQFRIVGRNPTKGVLRLRQIPGVQAVGEVADVAEELSRFDVSVAPLRIARGVQNKVLEALAAARPVVLTSKAAQGIGATNRLDYVVADSPADVSNAVCSLLADTQLRENMGQSARNFVAANRRWQPELEKLETLLTGETPRTSAYPHITTLPNYHMTKSLPLPLTA